MNSLSLASILEKNRLASDGAWLILLEIVLGAAHLHLVRNTENITWDGQEYTAFPFEMDAQKEDRQELTQLTIRVSNVSRVVQGYVEAAGGGTGATVIIRVVNSNHLDMPADLEEVFTSLSATADVHWVLFVLGIGEIMSQRFPADRNMRNYCRYKQFKGVRCGYNDTAMECNRTLARCRDLLNSGRFGGEPGLPGGSSAG